MILKNFVLGVCCLFFCCCSNHNTANKGLVHLEQNDGKYQLFRNGKPFNIKGASGYTHLDVLNAVGGNAIRVWDTVNIDGILQQAHQYHLAVIIGLPMADSEFMTIYNDTAKVNAQYRAFKALVNKYKHDPAVLMWCPGNELVFPGSLSYANFYKAFNNIVDMIHHDDPDHPVTTTMVNFQPKIIFNLRTRTNVDVISFNLFGRLSYLKNDLKRYAWLWKGPYMITEWGIDGPWEGTAQTAWGAYIEPNSTNKAEQYLARYKRQMPVDDPRFLGSFIFYWGQKQETTHTWFSLFDEGGARSAVVASAQYIWTGKLPSKAAPAISSMAINGKQAADNIILKPREQAQAELLMLKPDASIAKIQWKVYREDWFKKDGLNNIKTPKPIDGLILKDDDFKTSFIAPAKPGPYRIFVNVYDGVGNFATSNIPFYVTEDNK